MSLGPQTGMLPGLNVISPCGLPMSITFEGRIWGSPAGTETVFATSQLADLKPLLKKLPLWGSRLKVELSDSLAALARGRYGQREGQDKSRHGGLDQFHCLLSPVKKGFPPGRRPGPVSPMNHAGV